MFPEGFVAALPTRYILEFVLYGIGSRIPSDAFRAPADIFITYFLFCLYYFFFSYGALGKPDAAELQASLKRTRPKPKNALTAFIMGESGTSHATMFSISALIGVGAILSNAYSDDEASRKMFLQVAGLAALIGSWISNIASFALQFALDDADAGSYGFRSPDKIDPSWSDYHYAATMVSTTLSTSDVSVLSR